MVKKLSNKEKQTIILYYYGKNKKKYKSYLQSKSK